ncbi:MAG: YihY/virulence factor BrkB family protein [Thermoanaerobaculia bacterium]
MKKYFGLLKQTFKEFGDDKVPRLGAALSYYTIFSMAPLLLIVIGVAGLVFGHEAAQGQVFDQLKTVMGPATAATVQEMVKNAGKPKSGSLATIIGVITLILGASGVFGQLKDALNTIWDVKPKKSAGIMGLIKDRFLSASMVFGIGFLLLVSLVVDAMLAAVGKYGEKNLPGGEAIWHILSLVVSFVVVSALFAMIFRFLPDLKIEWRDVWLGAAFTSFLFVLGKFALGLYLAKSAVGSSFGAAGSLVVLLVWVYYSAQIVLFGAEFTQVYARAEGSVAAAGAVQKKRDAEEEAARPKAVSAIVPASPAASRSGGVVKMALGAVAGIFMGLLMGGIGASVLIVKSIRKLFS